jgi:hypothetical protein
MKNKHILIMLLATALLFGFIACHKDAQIESKKPSIVEKSVEPMSTEAYFTWTVDFPGKMSSVVKLSHNADMSNAITFGDDTPSNDKEFYTTATGLTKTTTYYYRFEAWNPNMYFVSEVSSYTTLDEGLASVTTAAVSNIGVFIATGGGNVTSDGNHSVIERGICWGTGHYPDISGQHVSSGSGTGSFTCNLTSLEPETKYYVRAYATNSIGTNYGDDVSFTTIYPIGAISVSSSEKVYFSQGNLQYRASDEHWRFAEHQYDYIGEDNSNISSTYSNYIDLFGWGTSGWNSGAVCYQPWSTSGSLSDYYPGGSCNNNLTGSYANADWGVYNAIYNGGNIAGQWRTLTEDEWWYVLYGRSDASSKYGRGKVNGVCGMILLPDSWTLPSGLIFTAGNSSYANVYTTEQWEQMEQNGAFFLPAAGYRSGTSVHGVGSSGHYWSASYLDSNSAWCVDFNDSSLHIVNGIRCLGQGVRLVRDL